MQKKNFQKPLISREGTEKTTIVICLQMDSYCYFLLIDNSHLPLISLCLPPEQKYGAGIYFTADVEEAKSLWTDNGEEYIYFIEALVLTGKHHSGSPKMIVPPPIGNDPLVRYDSVINGRGVHVIFSGQQAYPDLLITCRKQDKHTHV